MSNNQQQPMRVPNARERTILEFVVLRTSHGSYYLSRREGARVAAVLERWWTPRWIEFTDLDGALVRLRPRNILLVFDSSPCMRARETVRNYLLQLEEQLTVARLDSRDDSQTSEEDG